MKTANINVRVTETTIQQLDAIVNASLLDRSDHIRLAVSEYIARHSATTPAQVSHLSSLLSTEGETDPLEPAFPLESPLRVA